MRTIFLILLVTGFFSCENHRYDSDKRQIMAKNEIESKLRRDRSFDITGFNEEIVQNAPDTNFKKQIKYTLDFVYIDSNKNFQQKRGTIMFTPDGFSVISTKITDR